MRNKLKKVILTSLLTSTLFFAACSDDPVAPISPANEYKNSDSVNKSLVDYRKPKANITLKIDSRDAQYGIDSVKVILVNAKMDDIATTYTDSVGETVYKDLEMGKYQFLITKLGYAPIYQTVELQNESELAEVPKVPDVTQNVHLLKLGVSAIGQVVYTDKNGNSKPAASASLEVTLINPSAYDFVERFFTITTDTNGEYTIPNLIPELTDVNISAKSITVDGQRYKATNTGSIAGTFSGENEIVNTIKMGIDAAEFVVNSTNLADLKYNENLKIVFSEPIDTNEIEIGDIEVTKGTEIAIDYSISADLKTLTITPSIGGNWGTSGLFTLSLALKSTEGKALTETLNFAFKVTGAVANVTGLLIKNNDIGTPDTNVVNSITTDFDLVWNSLSNVIGYKIFIKSTVDSNYTLLSTVSDTTDNINCNGWFIENKSVSIIVIGYNTDNVSDINTTTPIVLSDKIGATMNNEVNFDIPFGKDLDNTGGTTALKAGDANVVFNEVMDTTAVTLVSPNPTIISYTWKWTSTTRAIITAYVLAGQDASAHSETLTTSIASLKDISGNVMSVGSDAISIDFQ